MIKYITAMKSVNKEVLKKAANNLMFDMSDDQYDRLLSEFDVILKQMELIGEIEGVDNETPMTFPYEVSFTYLREDVPSKPLDKDVALKNAKDVVDDQIRLPRVVK